MTDLGKCTRLGCDKEVTDRTIGEGPTGHEVIEVCEAEHEVRRAVDRIEVAQLLTRSFGIDVTREQVEETFRRVEGEQ